MATKRMFSKTITNSARFLKMPVDSQTLYFHLCMNADDDGIVEAYSVLKITGSGEDNLRVLVAKNFIRILNDDLVSHIIDWNEHNLIRADRKIDSIYKDLLLQIVPTVELIEARPRADLKNKNLDSPRTDNGRTTDGIGKVRLGKVRLGKDNNTSAETEEHPEEVIALTNRFYSQMQKPTKYVNKPPDLTKWYKPIHDLHRLDKIDYSLIEKVIDFATTDPFWKTVIQSTGKLREKFSQLEIKMQSQGASHNNKPAFDYEKQREENERLFGGK